MEDNEEEPEDVREATPVAEEIARAEVVEESSAPVPEHRPRKAEPDVETKPKKITKKPVASQPAKDDPCARKLKKSPTTTTVYVYEKPCAPPRLDVIPRHCLSKKEWLEMLATPSRKCPSPCMKKPVQRKLRPISPRINELAQPTRQRLLITLQERGDVLPIELVDRLISMLEGETCMTPEQAEQLFRDKKKKKQTRKSRKEKKQKCEDTKIDGREHVPSVNFDKEAVTCQYLMAEAFVKSILKWKCTIPKDEFKDIADVVIRRLGSTLEYAPADDADRTTQQMRFLADIVAAWIAGVLFEVAESRRDELERECEERRRMKEEQQYDASSSEESEPYVPPKPKAKPAEAAPLKRVEAEPPREEEKDEQKENDEKEKDEEKEQEEKREESEEAGGADEDTKPDDKKDDDDAAGGAAEAGEEKEPESLEPQQEEEPPPAPEEPTPDEAADGEEPAETAAAPVEAASSDVPPAGEQEGEPFGVAEAETPEETPAEPPQADETTGGDAIQDPEAASDAPKPEDDEDASAVAEAVEETPRDPTVPPTPSEISEAPPQDPTLPPTPAEVLQQDATVPPTPSEASAVLPQDPSLPPTPSAASETLPTDQEPVSDAAAPPVEALPHETIEEKVRESQEFEREATKTPSKAPTELDKGHEVKRPEKMDSDFIEGNLRKMLQTDVPFLDLLRILDRIENAVARERENLGEDPMTDRIHRAVYEKLERLVKSETPERLTEHLKDVLDVLSGKIARWVRAILTDSEVIFLNEHPPMVESGELRSFGEWIGDMSDRANMWTVWMQNTIHELMKMQGSQVTRGDWQNWTRNFAADALKWRRYYLESVHHAHHNRTMLAGREVVKTGEAKHPEWSIQEREINTTDFLQ